jgi:hypothetical protein
MPSGLINLALGLAMQVGNPGPSETPNFPPPQRAYGQYGFEGSAEQRYAFDSQMAWVHGYHQEIPAYGGHSVYRPYNYTDILSQSQTAAGWGERPAMPYSQQFWHKYHDQATMLKVSHSQPVPSPYAFTQHTVPQSQGWVNQPAGFAVPGQQIAWPHQSQQQVWSQSAPVVGASPVAVPANMSDSLQAPPLTSSEFNQIQYRR